MPNYSIYKLAILNIVTHPHSANDYVKLFRVISELKLPIRYHGDYHLMLSRFLVPIIQGDYLKGFSGEFYKFLQLDKNGGWYDIETVDEAKANQLDEIKIPDNLKPHFHKFRYFFYPETHKLFFEAKTPKSSLSPLHLKRYFDNLAEALLYKYNLSVSIVQDSTFIDEMLRLPQIDTLTVSVNKPNPSDNISDFHSSFMQQLNQYGAKTVKSIYKADKGRSITPQGELKNVINLAVTDGTVEVTGKDNENLPVQMVSQSHPRFESYKVDEKKELPVNQLQLISTMINTEFKKGNSTNGN